MDGASSMLSGFLRPTEDRLLTWIRFEPLRTQVGRAWLVFCAQLRLRAFGWRRDFSGFGVSEAIAHTGVQIQKDRDQSVE
jgi:hypothetical protein